MEKTGDYESCINVYNKGHNRIINIIVISGILEINKHGNKWFCAEEKTVELYG